MATLAFDTYKAISLLQKQGYSKQQAESLVTVLRSADLADVATTADVAGLKDAIINLDRSIQASRVEMYKVVAGQTLVIVGAIAALLQVL
ncbi:MAG TPA: hypothetical protein VMX97_14190 [Hyphomicrobiaceae bacterium]|nr:hypothetical protein [Hyphomicrobiaceae bacterium]